jgi:hypothetical protein
VKLRLPVLLGLVYVTIGFAIRPGLLEAAVTIAVSLSLVEAALMPERAMVWNPAFSLIAISAIGSIVGDGLGSGTAYDTSAE